MRAASLPALPPPESRLVLTGDAGDPAGAELLRALGAFVATSGANTTLAFLGDNFYPGGDAWRDPARRQQVLGAELLAGRAAAATWFVPGNHDWGGYRDGGDAERLRALSDWVDADPRAEWAPHAGCGGPERIDRGVFVLIALDSEWWLRSAAEREAMAPPGGCSYPTPEAAKRALAADLACDAADCAPRILIAHHPLASRGPHGTRGIGLREDLDSHAYRGYASEIRSAIAEHPPLVIAAGHDHSLQVLPGREPPFLVVSGAGSKPTHLASDGLDYGSVHRGFLALDFESDGAIFLRVFEHGSAEACGPMRLCETFRKALRGGS